MILAELAEGMKSLCHSSGANYFETLKFDPNKSKNNFNIVVKNQAYYHETYIFRPTFFVEAQVPGVSCGGIKKTFF